MWCGPERGVLGKFKCRILSNYSHEYSFERHTSNTFEYPRTRTLASVKYTRARALVHHMHECACVCVVHARPRKSQPAAMRSHSILNDYEINSQQREVNARTHFHHARIANAVVAVVFTARACVCEKVTHFTCHHHNDIYVCHDTRDAAAAQIRPQLLDTRPEHILGFSLRAAHFPSTARTHARTHAAHCVFTPICTHARSQN